MENKDASLYPHFHTLHKWNSPDWDGQTREALRNRLEHVPAIRFLDAEQLRVLTAAVDRILPQDDRPVAQRIPIVPWIDAKLYQDVLDGYRFEGMPPQREAWRLGLLGLNETATAFYHEASFANLRPDQQDEILMALDRGDAPGAVWQTMPSHIFFSSYLRAAVVKTYYAHPAAWDETGYNGPSSPRGHVRIWNDGVDPWEAHEGGAAHG